MKGCLWVITVLGMGLVATLGTNDTPSPLPKPTVDIQGYYTVDDTQGVVQITRIKQVYRVTTIFAGGDNAVGIGILNGNTLSLSWRATGAFGVTLYEVVMKDDKLTLVGRWAGIPGDGELREETLHHFKTLK